MWGFLGGFEGGFLRGFVGVFLGEGIPVIGEFLWVLEEKVKRVRRGGERKRESEEGRERRERESEERRE